MLVMTIDQRGSRRRGDRVDGLLEVLHDRSNSPGIVRGFERTAGDEIQGLLDDPELAVDIALRLLRTNDWYIGIGLGAVVAPIPRSVRAATGTAFVHAREAVERAKRIPQRIAVVGPDEETATFAEGLLRLLGTVVRRRTKAGWEVAELMDSGSSQKEVARKLGITPQAVSQRLRSGLWQEEQQNRVLAARLLAAAD
ncbi:MAG TPA: SatD family protein, partial [Actinopolymorphaceae bacterium]